MQLKTKYKEIAMPQMFHRKAISFIDTFLTSHIVEIKKDFLLWRRWPSKLQIV